MVYCIRSCDGSQKALALQQPLLIALSGNKLHPYIVVTSVGSFPGCRRFLELVDSSYVTYSSGWKWGGLKLFMFVRKEAELLKMLKIVELEKTLYYLSLGVQEGSSNASIPVSCLC